MKTNSGIVALFLGIFILTACKTKKPVVETPTENVSTETIQSNCPALSRGTAIQKDPIAEMDAHLKENCLQLKLRYSGGCKEHYFDLYWDGTWMKSKPAVAKLQLSHNSNEDMCEAIESEIHEFDISPLKVGESGQVIVEIFAEGTTMIRLSYTY